MQQDNTEPKGLADIVGYILRWFVAPPDDERYTIVDRVTTVISRFAMSLTVVIVAIMFLEVVLRYIFFSPTLWVNELSLWLGSMMYLLAGAYAMQRRSHIRITAFYDAVPRNVQRVFDFIAVLVVLLYVFTIVYAGGGIALDTLMRWEKWGTAWNPPIPATVKPLVHIAAILIAIQAISNFIVDFRKEKSEESPAPNVD